MLKKIYFYFIVCLGVVGLLTIVLLIYVFDFLLSDTMVVIISMTGVGLVCLPLYLMESFLVKKYKADK